MARYTSGQAFTRRCLYLQQKQQDIQAWHLQEQLHIAKCGTRSTHISHIHCRKLRQTQRVHHVLHARLAECRICPLSAVFARHDAALQSSDQFYRGRLLPEQQLRI